MIKVLTTVCDPFKLCNFEKGLSVDICAVTLGCFVCDASVNF